MSNITYRLVKGQELTFAEIDENFSSLDSDIRDNRRYFDSQLEQFGLGRDSDFLEMLAERDSDAAAIILSGIANHDSDIADLNAAIDSEHAWNVVSHNDLQANINSLSSSSGASIDSEHAWNVAEHRELADSIAREHAFNVAENNTLQNNMNQLGGNVDSEHAWNVSEHGALNVRLDSEHSWNVGENNSLLSEINTLENEFSSLQTTVNNLQTGTGGDLTLLGNRIDSEHAWNVAEHNSLENSLSTLEGTVSGNVLTAGTGISISGSKVISNSAPDQTVAITGTGATSVTGTYPNFTVNSTDNNTTYTAGSGMTLSGTQFINAAPDRTVAIAGTGATSVTGTYPNFTVNSTNTTYTAGNGLTLSGTQFLMSGSYTGTFTATGDVVAYSDIALKSEVTAIDEALDKLMSITGYTYNTKGSDRRHSGVMAQEVEEVLPEVVHTSEDGTKGVAYGNMMGLVIEAIRELKTQVDELKGR